MDFKPNATGHNVFLFNNATFRANYNKPLLPLLAGVGGSDKPTSQENHTTPSFPPESNIYDFGTNKTIRLVINNLYVAVHPMHLHGHNMVNPSHISIRTPCPYFPSLLLPFHLPPSISNPSTSTTLTSLPSHSYYYSSLSSSPLFSIPSHSFPAFSFRLSAHPIAHFVCTVHPPRRSRPLGRPQHYKPTQPTTPRYSDAETVGAYRRAD